MPNDRVTFVKLKRTGLDADPFEIVHSSTCIQFLQVWRVMMKQRRIREKEGEDREGEAEGGMNAN